MAGKTVEPGIRQLADRTYEVRVGVGRDETGRVVQRSRVVHGSIHEARKARAQLLLSAGATPKPSAATVAELGKRWLADLERRGKSPNTIHGYRSKWNHIDRYLGEKTVSRVTTTDLNRLYGRLADAGLSPASIRHVHVVGRAAFNEAIRWGWIERNPVKWARPPEHEPDEIKVPDEALVRQLIAEVAKERGGVEMSRLFFVAATTGARRAELCGLRWPDIDWTTGTMSISRSILDLPGRPIAEKNTKSRRGRRRIELDPATLAVLEDQRAAMEARAISCDVELALDGYCFSDAPDGSEPWHLDRVTHAFSRARERLGLDNTVRFHDLRHFVVTHALDAGVAIPTLAERTGHDPSIMLRVYGHGRAASNRRAGEVAAGLLVPPRDQ
ncbi:MAG TPA: site-specific integrase [Acidimicrobiales bacterium]|nr:site-specific integrase [Acidimicrobiales bacterium]